MVIVHPCCVLGPFVSVPDASYRPEPVGCHEQPVNVALTPAGSGTGVYLGAAGSAVARGVGGGGAAVVGVVAGGAVVGAVVATVVLGALGVVSQVVLVVETGSATLRFGCRSRPADSPLVPLDSAIAPATATTASTIAPPIRNARRRPSGRGAR
jgi:hypothetical protein